MRNKSANWSVADLFCGVGGLSMGFEQAGFTIKVALDNWAPALRTYNENFSHSATAQDLSDVKATSSLLMKSKTNLVIGGPPCQDFSHAGPRKEGARANLTTCFAEVIRQVKPAVFVMENVERAKGSRAVQNACKVFSAEGYGLTTVVLDASLCGVPQKRKRFFCIGVLGAADDALLPFILPFLDEKPLTVRQYFGSRLNTEYYYRHPRNYSRRGIYSVDEPSATIRGVNRPIPPNYPPHPADAAPAKKARPLTTVERAQIQTFPRNFKWTGSKTEVEQMIGNAVPVSLAKFVALSLRRFFEQRETR